uniref:Uncharacterized protein n=1 Tax=Magallana gigas TaxID=29159 RepID=A0A8W8LXT6_MAGGI
RTYTYGCNVTPDSFCWNGKGLEVEIAYQGKSPQGSSNYFKLKITQYKNFKVDWLTLIILAPFVGVAIIVAIIMVVVCRSQRAWCSGIPKSLIPVSSTKEQNQLNPAMDTTPPVP